MTKRRRLHACHTWWANKLQQCMYLETHTTCICQSNDKHQHISARREKSVVQDLSRVSLDLILEISLFGLQTLFAARRGRHGATESHCRAAQAHQLLLHFLQLPSGFRPQCLFTLKHPLQIKGLQQHLHTSVAFSTAAKDLLDLARPQICFLQGSC